VSVAPPAPPHQPGLPRGCRQPSRALKPRVDAVTPRGGASIAAVNSECCFFHVLVSCRCCGESCAGISRETRWVRLTIGIVRGFGASACSVVRTCEPSAPPLEEASPIRAEPARACFARPAPARATMAEHLRRVCPRLGRRPLFDRYRGWRRWGGCRQTGVFRL
jgi:hypothetical protein